MGKDNSGNKYYQNNKGKRWVIYNGEINASKIDSDWYQWMHYQTNSDPLKTKVSKHSWQKPHSDNKTGTEKAYRPNKITNKKKDFKNKKVENPRILYILILFMLYSSNSFSQEKLELENIQPSFETTLDSQNLSNEKEINTSKLKSKNPSKNIYWLRNCRI